MYQQKNNNFSPFLKDIQHFFMSRSVLARLILINVIVWLAIKFSEVFFYLLMIHNADISIFFSLPANIHSLLLKPWTLFTYMFLHEDFFHLFFNMISLYFGGRIFLEFLDEKKLRSTYIAGGLAGGLFFILSYNFFPVFGSVVSQAVLLGASASIVAVLVAVAVYVPEYKVNLFLLGIIKLKYIAISLVVLFTLSITKDNPGGHLAHLGGAFWGFIYAMQLKKGKDIFKFFNTFINLFSFKSRLKVNYKANKRPVSDEEYNRQKVEKQEKIDAVLDKISQSGYSSLTKEEKELLFDSINKNK